MSIASIIVKFMELLKRKTPVGKGKFRYNFYDDRIYYEGRDVTEEFHEALVDYLTQYKDIPEGMIKVARFTHKGRPWKITITDYGKLPNTNAERNP